MHLALIQIVLLALLVISLLIAVVVMRNQIAGRLFYMAQFVVGAVFVLMPDWLSRVASWVGVGRGTDLLLYLIIMLFYITALCIIAKFRRIERTQTEIIRAMALRDARDNTRQ